MKVICIIILTILFGVFIWRAILADYEYNNQYGSYWELADKASTLEQKSKMINEFVARLENSGESGHNAIWLKTPDNSWDKNMEALKTLQLRLEEIKTMNPNSFEYQQAISQITSQEQGEADKMLHTIEGIWYKNNHFFLWSWIGTLIFIFLFFSLLIGSIVLLTFAFDL